MCGHEPPQTPAHLLVPAVAAATHDVLVGDGLTGRSAGAFDEAISQLQGELIALAGTADPRGGPTRVALVAPASASLEFAALALEAVGQFQAEPPAMSGRPDEIRRTRLDFLTTTLASARTGDPEAAEIVRYIFDLMLDRMFFGTQPVDIVEIHV